MQERRTSMIPLAEEFERLLRAGAEGTDLPEVDDGELDPVEQGSSRR